MRSIILDRASLDRLEPLWQAHADTMKRALPSLNLVVDSVASWNARHGFYLAALDDGGRALLAATNDKAVGYAIQAERRMPWPATFDLHPRLEEIVSLVVSPHVCGDAIATVIAALVERRGDRAILAGTPAWNEPAGAALSKQGLGPAWATLIRGKKPQTVAGGCDVRVVAQNEVAALRATWLSLHRHHQLVAPELGPFVDDDRSWDVFRRVFERASAQGLLLIAGELAAPLGLVCATTAVSPTFLIGLRDDRPLGEIEALMVAPGARGRGIGASLLASVTARLRDLGIDEQIVGAIASNRDAIRFYEREGFHLLWVDHLMRANSGS